MSKETTLNLQEAPTLKKSQYIAYGLGDFGNNFSWTFVSTFLMFFYTDVFGISAASVATLVLVARIWDAVNDPFVGALADRTKSRWGRYRPWPLFAAPFCAILVVLTYWARPDWSGSSKLIYMYVTYFLLVLAYTCVNLPYGTLASVMTQNINERAKVSSVRFLFAFPAMQIINAVTNPLVTKFGGGNNQKGFLIVACVYACIFMVCHVICFSKVREVVELPKQQKIPMKIQFKAVSKNLPFILAVIAQTIWGFTIYGRSASYMYYFKYVENDIGLFTVMSLLAIAPKILGVTVFPSLFKKVENKGKVAAIVAVGMSISLFALHFFRASASPIPFFTLVVVSEFLSGIFTPAAYGIVPDTVEYGEWKTGIRNDGFQYAFVSLGNKVGMAVGTAGIAAILGMAGYVANQDQSPQVISVISHFFTTIPAVLWLVVAVALTFYKIDKTSFQKMVSEIKARKATEI